MDAHEKWLSVEEIANHLGVSKETIYRWLARKTIPAHRIGKLWKFQSSEVDHWVKIGGANLSTEFQNRLELRSPTTRMER